MNLVVTNANKRTDSAGVMTNILTSTESFTKFSLNPDLSILSRRKNFISTVLVSFLEVTDPASRDNVPSRG